MGYRRNGRRGVKRKTVEQRINAKRATAHWHVPDRGQVDPHTGESWQGIAGAKMALGAVDSDVLATAAVTTAKIADEAVGSTKISAGLTNPMQDTPGLRSIGPALGGSSVRVSASDHSHGSGNTLDFDYLPEVQRRRALRVRQYLRNHKGDMFSRTGTAGERLVQLENRCEALTFMVLSLARCLIDAADLTAEERQAARDAGHSVKDFFEYRMADVKNEDESFHDRTLPGYANEHPDMNGWIDPSLG
jgi:hypothetical protein